MPVWLNSEVCSYQKLCCLFGTCTDDDNCMLDDCDDAKTRPKVCYLVFFLNIGSCSSKDVVHQRYISLSLSCYSDTDNMNVHRSNPFWISVGVVCGLLDHTPHRNPQCAPGSLLKPSRRNWVLLKSTVCNFNQ